MPTDFQNFETPTVVAINGEDIADSSTCYNGTGLQVPAGHLLVTSSLSDENLRVVDFPSADGKLVTDICRFKQAIDSWETTDDPYLADPEAFLTHPLQTYKLSGRVEFLVPVSAIADGQGTISPGQYLCADHNGRIKKSSSSTDYIVFQALTEGVQTAGGTFRVMHIGAVVK